MTLKPARRLGLAALLAAVSLLGACGGESEDQTSCQVGEFCDCSSNPCPDPVAETCDPVTQICVPRQVDNDVAEADASDVTDTAEGSDTIEPVDTADAEGSDTTAPPDVVEDVEELPTLEVAIEAHTAACIAFCERERECNPEASGEGSEPPPCAGPCEEQEVVVRNMATDADIACLDAIADDLGCRVAQECADFFSAVEPDGECFADYEEALNLCGDVENAEKAAEAAADFAAGAGCEMPAE